MTPEEKANELYHKFKPLSSSLGGGIEGWHKNSKEAAIIVCDEFINELINLHKPEYTTFRVFDGEQMDGYEVVEYWRLVKKEINKL